MKPRQGSSSAGALFGESERRRSARVPLSLPVRILDSASGIATSRKNAVIVDANLHAAKLTGNYPARVGQRFILDVPALEQAGWAEVVRIERSDLTWGATEIGIRLAKAQNLWGVDHPPEDWQETPGVPRLRDAPESQEIALTAHPIKKTVAVDSPTAEGRTSEAVNSGPDGDGAQTTAQWNGSDGRFPRASEGEPSQRWPEVSPARPTPDTRHESAAHHFDMAASNHLKAEVWAVIEPLLAEVISKARLAESEQAREAAIAACQEADRKLKRLVDRHVEEAARRLKELRIRNEEEARPASNRADTARTTARAEFQQSSEHKRIASRASLDNQWRPTEPPRIALKHHARHRSNRVRLWLLAFLLLLLAAVAGLNYYLSHQQPVGKIQAAEPTASAPLAPAPQATEAATVSGEAVSAVADPPRQAAPRPVAAAKVGQLVVTSNIAGARISLDGRSEPNWFTPHTFRDVPAGALRVVVSKQGYTDYERSVTLQSGRTATLQANLAAPSGLITIVTTPPGAQVLINEKPYGPSPVSATLPLGRHSYKVLRSGLEPFESSFELKTNGHIITRKVDLSGDAALRQSGE